MRRGGEEAGGPYLQQRDGDEDTSHYVDISRKPALQGLDAAFREDGFVPLTLGLCREPQQQPESQTPPLHTPTPESTHRGQAEPAGRWLRIRWQGVAELFGKDTQDC